MHMLLAMFMALGAPQSEPTRGFWYLDGETLHVGSRGWSLTFLPDGTVKRTGSQTVAVHGFWSAISPSTSVCEWAVHHDDQVGGDQLKYALVVATGFPNGWCVWIDTKGGVSFYHGFMLSAEAHELWIAIGAQLRRQCLVRA